MGAQRYVCREQPDGTLRVLPLDKPLESRKDLDPENMTFHEKVLRAYHEVDCNGGYRGAYPKNMVKRLHEDAIARGE
jgi:hypothetical protein